MKKIIYGILAILVFIAVGVVLRYTTAFNGFLDKITDWGPETKEYSVIAMNDNEISILTGLKNKGVGFLKTDKDVAKAEQRLNSIVEIDVGYYDDLDTMVEVLESGITDGIVLETNRLGVLEEEAENFLEDKKVIGTFEIELDNEEVAISEKEVTTEPFIIYISGSDSRTGIKTTARSDVNIVAVVNPKQGKILLVSIPRDTYVQLYNTTGLKDKLTHAGIYGIIVSKATIEDFLEIKIDHTLKVGFEAVVKVVDELDGIDIESEQAMTLKASTEGGTKVCDYIVGKQHVDGDCALRFARERKSYQTGDRHRGENQQQVITSIISKLSSSKDYLLKAPAILDVAADLFETTLERDDIIAFIRLQLTNSINWKVESIAIDGAGTMEPTYSMGANRPLYVMLPSEDSVSKAKEKINEYLENEEQVVDE